MHCHFVQANHHHNCLWRYTGCVCCAVLYGTCTFKINDDRGCAYKGAGSKQCSDMFDWLDIYTQAEQDHIVKTLDTAPQLVATAYGSQGGGGGGGAIQPPPSYAQMALQQAAPSSSIVMWQGRPQVSCNYGVNCYRRKNPLHSAQFSHPQQLQQPQPRQQHHHAGASAATAFTVSDDDSADEVVVIDDDDAIDAAMDDAIDAAMAAVDTSSLVASGRAGSARLAKAGAWKQQHTTSSSSSGTATPPILPSTSTSASSSSSPKQPRKSSKRKADAADPDWQPSPSKKPNSANGTIGGGVGSSSTASGPVVLRSKCGHTVKIGPAIAAPGAPKWCVSTIAGACPCMHVHAPRMLLLLRK